MSKHSSTKNDETTVRNEKQWYSNSLHKFPQLPENEQLKLLNELAEARANGDMETVYKIADVLFRHNQKLVASVVNKFTKNHCPAVSYADKGQEASIALFDCIKSFKPERSSSLSAYAVNCMNQALIRLIEKYSHRSRYSVHCTSVILDAQEKLRQQLGREADLEELSAETKLSVKVIQKRMQENKWWEVSLQSPVSDSDDDTDSQSEKTLESVLSETTDDGFDSMAHDELKGILHDLMLDELNETERRVLYLHYGLDGEKPLTLQETGERIGLTQGQRRNVAETVRRLQVQALAKLRNAWPHIAA